MSDEPRVQIRTFQPNDTEPLRAILFAAFDAGELNGASRADIERWLSRLPADPAATLVAVVDGEVAGLISPRREQMAVDARFRRRGVGRRLVEAGAALVRAEGDGRLDLWLPHDSPGGRAFLERLGFAYHHSLWSMRLRDDAVVPSPAFRPDVEHRSYRDADLVPFVDLFNRSFADHPTPMSVTVPLVEHAHAEPDFDPAMIRLVTSRDEPDRLIGFCRVRCEPSTSEGQIGTIGVVPEWRGRGLGRALLRWGVHELRARGAVSISLAVEGENERALALYRAEGFEPVEAWPRWSRSIT